MGSPSTDARWAPIRVAALWLTVSGWALTGCSSEEPVERPRNVLLFVVDTLRADRLGCYGYERDTSPAIDKFARQGTLFQSNHSQACWTVPSMISMMSGLYVSKDEQGLPSTPAMAEVIQAGGIRTAAFVGNRTLTNDRGFRRGFDHFEGAGTGGMNGLAHSLVQHFEAWYEGNASDLAEGDGWFAWVHPIDPHDPYEPSEKFRKFQDQPLPNESELRERWRTAEPLVEQYAADGQALDFEAAALNMRALSNLYDGEVLQVDDAFDQLLIFLERVGELEDTLVIFASDHGEKLWEHTRYPRGIQSRVEGTGGAPEGVKEFFAWGHRSWFHEELWNTPLMIVGPGMPETVRSYELSANLDIYPTILDAFDLAPPPHLAGRSLLHGDAPSRDRVFAHGFDTAVVLDRSGKKLVEHPPITFLREEGSDRIPELFDIANDPDELTNQADALTQDRAELEAALARWRIEHDRELRDSELSEADKQALEDLGYTGDE